MLIISTALDSDLQAIKDLQEKNLSSNLDPKETASEGFLTAAYSLDFLKLMHHRQPSIVAREDGRLAGYALITYREDALHHPLLKDLVDVINRTRHDGILLNERNYVVVGQLCVAKEFRGRDIVQKLYAAFRLKMQDRFDCCITDVASSNPRSLKAHLSSGFQIIDTLDYGGLLWNLVLWDWTNPSTDRGV